MTNLSTDPVRAELAALFDKHRGLFLYTAQGLTDDQVRLTPTASELSVGGLIKHVAAMTTSWLDFVERGAPAEQPDWENAGPEAYEEFAAGFRLLPDETLAGTIAAYDAVHARALGLVAEADLDQTHPLPAAPWFPPGEAWSNRRVFVHLIAEIAQHAGHADVIRETIDGQKSMG